MSRAFLWAWLFIMVVLDIVDIWTTYIGLSDGGEELNPFAAWVFERFGLNVGLLVIGTVAKVLALVFAWLVFNWAFKKADMALAVWAPELIRGFVYGIMLLTVVTQFVAVTNNLIQLASDSMPVFLLFCYNEIKGPINK